MMMMMVQVLDSEAVQDCTGENGCDNVTKQSDSLTPTEQCLFCSNYCFIMLQYKIEL